MADFLGKNKPYYDDYDPSKQFTHILAVPGEVEQAREFTQMQTMIYSFLKRLSDTLLKDGAIVAGMGYTITAQNKLIVEDGRVYLDGKIHEFKKQEIAVTKKGAEVIGVKLVNSIVTSETDVSLLDPAQEMENYGQPGAHRIKSVPVLTLNDLSSPTLFELEEGQLKVEVSRPAIDGITDILARRTYDESGNYRVVGLDLFCKAVDANNIEVTVEAGKAYIKGYEVIKPTPVKKLLPISKDFTTTFNEPKIFTTGTTKYALNNFPAKAIKKVVAMVEVTETVTRGAVVDGSDPLSKTPVVSIQEVKAGGVTYVQGTDYQLTSDKVNWSFSNGAKEPAVGSTYTVTYRYNKTMVLGTDYDLFQEVGAWGDTVDYLRFLNGDKPVNNSQLTVDYEHYLARIDHFSLDQKGNIIVTSGQPAMVSSVAPPYVNDDSLLGLGTVYFPPASGNAEAKTSTVTRSTMYDIQKMFQRLEDVEYNQAITALDRETMAGESPSELKGVFSDSFRSSFKGDLNHKDFSVMYSLEDGMIMLPPLNTKSAKPTINNTTSNIKSWGRLISAPMVEKVTIDQPYATTTMKINPYLAFNTLGVLKLTPEVDNWLETEYIKIEETEFAARNFYRWWRHGEDPSLKDNVSDLFDLEMENGQKVGEWRPEWWPGVTDQTGVAIKTEKSTSIMKEAITYMRQTEVQFKATNLAKSSDNLELFFDGVRVALTPLSGYQAGSTPGTVRSNSSGIVEAKFTIPPNIRTGTREVTLKNHENVASSAFTSIGTKETTTDKILRTRITLQVVDPLAQTFQFDQDTILTSVGGFFAAKDSTNNVIVQIRNVVNGYPGPVVYGEKVLVPNEITISDNAMKETKVTFDDPVFCAANTQFCVVYQTDSAEHSMYVADLGKTDVTTGELVTRQPYLAGMLFSSKNGLAWSAHQAMNMKFKVYTAEFQPTGTVEFDPITNLSADKILLLTDYLTPQNTGCIWEVSLDDQPFQPIARYRDLDTNKVVAKVRMRATFKSDKNMSPLMAKDSFTFVGFLTATEGSYISRATVIERDASIVKQSYEAFVPQGCTITPQFSLDDGKTWITPTQVSSVQVASGWFKYSFEKAVTLPNQRTFRARVNIKSNSSVVRPKVRKLMNIVK